MKEYFVYWSQGYDLYDLESFGNKKDALEFINERVKYTDFTFSLIEGKMLEVEPVKTIIKYKIKE